MATRYDLPGQGEGWTKLKGDQGWRDRDGRLWKKDKLHKNHWDVTDPRTGNKVLEVDFDGHQLWPGGRKHRGSKPS